MTNRFAGGARSVAGTFICLIVGFGYAKPAPRLPSVVFFLKSDCGCTKASVPDLNALARGLRGRAEVFGLMDAGVADVALARKELGCRFPISADPAGAKIRRLGGQSSLDFALLSPTGKVVKVYEGLSRAAVADLLARLKTRHGSTFAVDPKQFPEAAQVGCIFVFSTRP